MALSKPVIKAQDIVCCDLCESETKLKWKCLDCDLLMCNKCCDKVHPKFKNATDHTIVDIKQVGVSDSVRNPDFTNIKCKEHTTQPCCIFCSSCNKLACPTCITKGHAGHTFVEIKEAYEMKIEWLKNRKGKLEKNEKKLSDGEKTLDQIAVRENSNCKKTIQDIQHQREALKREVDKYALQLIEEVNQNLKDIKDSISEEEKKVKTSKQKEKNNLKTAEEKLTTMDMSFFFENADIIAQSIDVDIEGVNVIHKNVPKFKPGNISQSNVGTLFEDITFSSTVIDMKVSHDFTTGLKHCHHISACSDGSLWIGDGTSKLLQKVKLEGGILTTVLIINTELRGIAVTHNNGLLISDGTEKLKIINGKTGKVSDSKYNADPLGIIAVNITSDHKVIVGAMSPSDVYPVAGRRVVIVMDKKGSLLTMYENDKHKQRIFSYPKSITTTSNENIFVVDKITDDWRGRVLVFGQGSDILNEYTGCGQDIKTNYQPFKPISITTTPSDNVIVIDFYDHFHILDTSGNLLFYYNTDDIGIEYSYSIVFTSATTFYLGCSPVNSIIAKLYQIQCSGF
ncbi:tripartite motif-containing protein 9/67 [Mytilus galloprovincialis]|uniref:Tripartite motif-containing protein 9/67 n=1 Tax=Mytilus galloprovincialis TaxID=29158 RepID=A0A8B6GWK2_MYTGA|nr:tripartite motif-containing protein 9/67 [Mytilus galloprovincialis]